MKIGDKVQKIQECFRYGAGRLFWMERPAHHFASQLTGAAWNKKFAGKPITSTAGRGYLRARLNGKNIYAHHIVWVLHRGSWPSQQLDHINHDITDNRIENLREASALENSRNSTRKSSNTSGVNGVHWLTRERKWQAQIRIDGKRKSLGYFDSIADAEDARQRADVAYGFHTNHGKTNNATGRQCA